MPDDTPQPNDASPSTPVRLRLTREARDALAAALAGRPSGSGVRVWVERGMRPHAQMMIDHASIRDVPVIVDGIPLLVDESSLKFLLDAEIRYHSEPGRVGFEVVGPFLPATAPAPSGGTSAPPTPRAPATSGTQGTGPARPELEEKIREALKNIYDPEIPMNIVDLGLIYGMDWDASGGLTIRMTMTSPGCPVVEELTQEVATAARNASGVEKVQVEVVWEPPWGPDKMTDFARRQFGYA
ncbi:MAG TPA: metal-sulfur cluster assembly factor [Thermoplasmata archaeon]|nr:metal-sulfur cluster assembly factor [Thermoplasmata archaeon]